MSSLHRALDGTVLIHHLTQDERTIDRNLLVRSGRSSRTLVKEGPLRLTLMALAPGGALPAHHAAGPVTIHVLEGAVQFQALAQDYALQAGDLLVFAAGVEHSARSETGATLLLTVVHDSVAPAPAR
jgi:quercetin dioxygenase-like cupin family protein